MIETFKKIFLELLEDPKIGAAIRNLFLHERQQLSSLIQEVRQMRAFYIMDARAEKERDQKMVDTLDDIFAEVEKDVSVGNSIVTLVERLLTQQGVDPVRREAILTALRTDREKLEQIVLANTPAEIPTE